MLVSAAPQQPTRPAATSSYGTAKQPGDSKSLLKRPVADQDGVGGANGAGKDIDVPPLKRQRTGQDANPPREIVDLTVDSDEEK